jgi:hypothetical protein
MIKNEPSRGPERKHTTHVIFCQERKGKQEKIWGIFARKGNGGYYFGVKIEIVFIRIAIVCFCCAISHWYL